MKVVIAIDSLKGSLSSLEAGESIATGIRRVYPKAEILVRPLADGGEGTVETLVAGMGGTLEQVTVTGPLGEPIVSTYGMLPETKTAILEMASAAGITLVPKEKRNPMFTTTYGVGEMIVDAMEKGCRRFLIGIGGSVTNDGGIGMLQALGYGFLDKEGNSVPFGAAGLEVLQQITTDHVLSTVRECTFQIACDVTNPLCGAQGCSAIFGPQKGATPEQIAVMDGWMEQYATLVKRYMPYADPMAEGAGAAGGLGFAFLAFTNSVLKSGSTLVLEETKLADYIKTADIVITGEGRLDGQTAMGKAPIGVAKLAKQYKKPVIAFSGSVTREATACNQEGIDAYFPILQSIVTLEEAMEQETARENMIHTVEQVFRLIQCISKK